MFKSLFSKTPVKLVSDEEFDIKLKQMDYGSKLLKNRISNLEAEVTHLQSRLISRDEIIKDLTYALSISDTVYINIVTHMLNQKYFRDVIAEKLIGSSYFVINIKFIDKSTQSQTEFLVSIMRQFSSRYQDIAIHWDENHYKIIIKTVARDIKLAQARLIKLFDTSEMLKGKIILSVKPIKEDIDIQKLKTSMVTED